MPAWPPKDPDSVLDYLYTIPLDAGDSVASHSFEKLSGDVVIDSHSRNANKLTVWLSGGTDGETSVFRVGWTTAGGRADEDIVTILVQETQPTPVTSRVRPTSDDLQARYPAFLMADEAVIAYWIEDATRTVTEDWPESDYAPAILALAAHNMTLLGIGKGTLPAGVTRFKSGAMDVAVSESAANAAARGGYGSTPYGREFASLLRRRSCGPRLVGRACL